MVSASFTSTPPASRNSSSQLELPTYRTTQRAVNPAGSVQSQSNLAGMDIATRPPARLAGRENLYQPREASCMNCYSLTGGMVGGMAGLAAGAVILFLGWNSVADIMSEGVEVDAAGSVDANGKAVISDFNVKVVGFDFGIDSDVTVDLNATSDLAFNGSVDGSLDATPSLKLFLSTLSLFGIAGASVGGALGFAYERIQAAGEDRKAILSLLQDQAHPSQSNV